MNDGARPGGGRRGWRRVRERLGHPFWGSVAVLVVSYLFFTYGLHYLPLLVGVESAPVPGTVVLQYMGTALVGVLLYVSADEERWRMFLEPPRVLMTDPDRAAVRNLTLVAVSLLAGYVVYQSVKPSYGAPPALRSVHPANPTTIDFRGETIQLTGLENPLRHEGDMEEHHRTGARIYARNCVGCHGDRLDGQGHFADAFNPPPADFTSGGTIAQLTEAYVFWRIAKGGPGLPSEGTPWDSAMPAWEEILTQDEIWAVIIYLYRQSGATPRTWEEEEVEAEEMAAVSREGRGT